MAEASRQDELKYEISLTALKEMGYSAICVGEKDLLLGIDYLKYVQQSSSTPLLACNLVNQGKVIFSPYLLKTYKVDSTQLRVAVIGVISKAFEEFIKNADAVPSVKRPSANSLELLKPEVAIRLLIEQLENKADLIILLAHVSIEEAKGLASMFPQVNVIIAGHEQQVPLTKPLHEGDCIILNAGTEGKYVGKMEMIVASTGKRKVIVETNHQMIALTDKIPDSPLMTELMSLYQQMLEAEDLVHKVKKVSPDSEGTYVGSERCRSCHEEIYLEWEKSAHSHVYATLVKRKRNLDPECVQCHVTGFRYQTGFVDTQKTPALANVGCESCHGVGSNHVKNLKNGYGQTKKEICRTCHTPQKSPKFNYVEYLSKNSH
ncbi:MAG: hypothetical protein H8D67_28480 [Deltaproteobacteria bacterium]|nr:hypothetical protein [Deltaproteobacteria bacterium]